MGEVREKPWDFSTELQSKGQLESSLYCLCQRQRERNDKGHVLGMLKFCSHHNQYLVWWLDFFFPVKNVSFQVFLLFPDPPTRQVLVGIRTHLQQKYCSFYTGEDVTRFKVIFGDLPAHVHLVCQNFQVLLCQTAIHMPGLWDSSSPSAELSVSLC